MTVFSLCFWFRLSKLHHLHNHILTYQNQFDFFLIVLHVSNGLGSLPVSDTSEPEMKQTCLPMDVNKTQLGSTLNPCNSLPAPTLQLLYTKIRTYIYTYVSKYTHTYLHTYRHTYLLTYIQDFLRAIAEFRKATISFVMSVRPSVCPHGTTQLPLDRFS